MDQQEQQQPYLVGLRMQQIAFSSCFQRVYATATMNHPKSDVQSAIESLVYNFLLLLNFLAHGIPFYIYTLTGGRVFRTALWNVFFRLF